jgi:hypothetical protein
MDGFARLVYIFAPSPSMNTSSYYQLDEQRNRRTRWFQATREIIPHVLNPDGTPRIPQFDSPHRETLWAAAALYTGSQSHIDMINGAIARWHDGPRRPGKGMQGNERETHGSDFGIFQTNTMIHLYHRFRELLTPGAEKVMRTHVEYGPRTFRGSGQPDTKFHGANDNMPMMAAQGLIFSGEILGNPDAVKQGLWYLNQARLLLSRNAWLSEWNSSTYSMVTLSHVAQLANYSHTAEVREIALEIEHRLWAELLLHYHPPTFMQAGPQCRAYECDETGHTHSTQLLFWAVFGPELSGRDPLRSFLQPDGREVIHFEGCPYQTIAEFVHFLDGDFHLPVELAALFTKRQYPARLRGRAESMGNYDLSGNVYHTETYMEETFSLGTSNVPLGGGEQTASFFATYKRKPEVVDFRDASTVFFKYNTHKVEYGAMARSSDGAFEGEKYIPNQGWARAMQKDNAGLLLVTPNLKNSPVETDTLRLDLVFPAHYGRIARTIIGDGPVRDGAVGESAEVAPVSIEAGEVYIHVMPLIPTSLPRQAAVRFSRHNDRYEVLELINYEGPARTFSRKELGYVANGCVLTIDAKTKYASLEEFHRAKSKALITDYVLADLRFVDFKRDDVWFEQVYGPRSATVMTEAVDGRTVPHPIFESNQIDVNRLPFVTGPVKPNVPLFPWKDSLEICWYPDGSWIIGSRGLPEEKPYSRRVELLRTTK